MKVALDAESGIVDEPMQVRRGQDAGFDGRDACFGGQVHYEHFGVCRLLGLELLRQSNQALFAPRHQYEIGTRAARARANSAPSPELAPVIKATGRDVAHQRTAGRSEMCSVW